MSSKDTKSKAPESPDKSDVDRPSAAGPGLERPRPSSLSSLPPPRGSSAAKANASAPPAAPAASTATSLTSAGSGVDASGAVGGVRVSGGVVSPGAAINTDDIIARVLSAVDAKLASIALSSLPPPSDDAKHPKAGGLLTSLITASGHSGAAAADSDDRKHQSPSDGQDGDSGDNADEQSAAVAPNLSTTTDKKDASGVDLSKRIGVLLWKEEIAPYNSALSFVRMNTFREARNRHECESLALSLDEMVRERIPMTNVSFEILVRRLLGVRLADEYKDWSFAEALAWKSGHGVQNRGLLRSLLKDRKSFADLKKPTAAANSNQSFKGAALGRQRKSGRGGRFNTASNPRQFGSNARASANNKPSSATADAARN